MSSHLAGAAERPRTPRTLGYLLGPNGTNWQDEDPKDRSLCLDAEGQWRPFFLDTNKNYSMPINSSSGTDTIPWTSNTTSQDRNIVFGSMRFNPNPDVGGIFASVRNCTVRMRYIEANVSCHKSACSVQSLRQAPAYLDRNPSLTSFDTNPVLISNLAADLPRSFGSVTHEGTASPTELFIEGQVPFGNFSLLIGEIDDLPILHNLSDDTFARRLGIVLNTYINLGMGPQAFAGNLPAPSTGAFGPYDNGTDEHGHFTGLFYPQKTTSTNSELHEIYVCNSFWLTLFLASTLLLTVVTVVGTYLKHLCLAPDVFGYVSRMTYNNEYFALPPGGTLDVMERSRLLNDMQCRVGDVAEGPVGRVVFAADEPSYSVGRVSKLRRDMMYV